MLLCIASDSLRCHGLFFKYITLYMLYITLCFGKYIALAALEPWQKYDVYMFHGYEPFGR